MCDVHGAAPVCRSFMHIEEIILAKPNYSFEKRQREIAKKKQQDEKQARKQAAREEARSAESADSTVSGQPVDANRDPSGRG